MHIIEQGLLDNYGIYHYTDEGVASWYDFAQAIKEISGKPAKVVAIKNEGGGWRWAILAACYTTAVGYLAAWLTYLIFA